jgi:hypothetical protein
MLSGSIATYQKEKGKLPETLGDIPQRYAYGKKDSWGRAFIYQKTADGFVLISYGEDGKPGGNGLNADITSNMKPKDMPPITFAEYIRSGAYMGNVWGSLFVALVAFLAPFMPQKPVSSHPKEQEGIPNRKQVVETIIPLVVLVVIGGVFGGLMTLGGLADGGH